MGRRLIVRTLGEVNENTEEGPGTTTGEEEPGERGGDRSTRAQEEHVAAVGLWVAETIEKYAGLLHGETQSSDETEDHGSSGDQRRMRLKTDR